MTFNAGYSPIDYPTGLEREVLRVLSYRQGRDKALSRSMLLECVLRGAGCAHVTDRQLRAAINQLRKDGHLICSTGGEDGGYWTPAAYDELEEYLNREVYARISDLSEQAQAMRRAAKERWDAEITEQGRMF